MSNLSSWTIRGMIHLLLSESDGVEHLFFILLHIFPFNSGT